MKKETNTTTKNKIVSINGKRGEYTGFSYITMKHHFSMYDGSVIKLSEMETIRLFGIDFVNSDKKLK